MQTIPPYASLRRYSPECAHHLGRIRAALGRIAAASIWPASAEALRFAAQVGTVHYSTLIEGNRLGLLEAERAARRELDARTRAELELVNYVDALDLLDRRLDADGLAPTEDMVKAIHYEATKGLGTPDGPFMPHHEGSWRDGEAGVWDPVASAFVHAGAPNEEVRPRMLGLLEWVRSAEGRPVDWPPAVIAGVVHYNVAEVHPFADGNGRTARLLTTAILMRHGLAPGRLFNFDAHYGVDKDRYLAALRSVREQTLNLETWMRYFLDGLATEYERVAGEVDRLAAIQRLPRDGGPLQLSEAQQRGIAALLLRGVSEFTRREYEQAAGVGRATATRDLRVLADAGVLDRLGDGSARRYRIVGATSRARWEGMGGRPRAWTDERIERELRALLDGADAFPTVARFDEAGRRDLYNAIQRHGGSGAWASRLGIEPPRRGRVRRRGRVDKTTAGG